MIALPHHIYTANIKKKKLYLIYLLDLTAHYTLIQNFVSKGGRSTKMIKNSLFAFENLRKFE